MSKLRYQLVVYATSAFFLLVAFGSLYLVTASHVILYTTGEIPVFHLFRRGSENWPDITTKPFTSDYFQSLFTYMVMAVLGLVSLVLVFRPHFGMAVLREFIRPLRFYVLLAIIGVGFVLPILVAAVQWP
jgi:hypothetical protein